MNGNINLAYFSRILANQLIKQSNCFFRFSHWDMDCF